MVDLSLALDGAEHAGLRVLRFTLRERINEPFVLSLVAGSTLPDLDLEDLLLRPASFTIDAEGLHVLGGARRRLTGLCAAAEQLSVEARRTAPGALSARSRARLSCPVESAPLLMRNEGLQPS